MKKIALSLALLVFTGNCIAQNINVDIATERNLMSRAASKKIIADGSPYVNENFRPIRIEQFKGQVYTGRYNAYNDEMEVRLADGKIVALDNNADYTVKFTGVNEIYKTASYVTENGSSRRGFLALVDSSDKHKLFKREYIKYYEKVQAASSYQQDKPARFKREDDSYYLELNGKVTSVPQKKKDFIKAFPDHSTKLKSFLKTNKLNPKNEEDLVKAIEYLSTL